ncbi:MAG TPA: VWA domain-containing protein [Acidimicrobiia bacterium]|nr:VWA domain-containing protein [Acidimicrobiia bacterium]
MTFTWPWALLAFVAVPLVLLTYLWQIRRKRKYAVKYASLSLIREALPKRSSWWRHVPAALLLTAMLALVFAMARPQAVVAVSRNHTSIMLTLDVSRSMCSTDVAPNRLTAAQNAARKFIDEQPEGTRIGIVAFSGAAQVLVPPTTDGDRLKNAVDNLTTGMGTVIGNGLLASLDALSKVNRDIAPSTVKLTPADRNRQRFAGKYEPDIIVLLTDGAATGGVNPIDAARQAADRRVRIYTVGFGTNNPGTLVCTAEQLGASDFGPFGGSGGFGGGGSFRPSFGGGRGNFLDIDEQTLKSIAKRTGGTYNRASSASQLIHVFRDLPKRITTQSEHRELSVYLVGLAALLATAGLGLSLWWNRYP